MPVEKAVETVHNDVYMHDHPLFAVYIQGKRMHLTGKH